MPLAARTRRGRAPYDGAARLRPVHQGEPRLQPSRRARGDLGDRAAELHPAGARTGQSLRRRLAHDGGGRRRVDPHPPGQRYCPLLVSGFLMPDLFLELFSEEIPARMQRQAAEDLRRLVTNALVDRNLTYEGAQALVTPRRLALHVVGLPAAQPTLREERKGPRVGAT